MRILHVIASVAPRYGGPSSAIGPMCAALAARGHDVDVLTTDVDGPGRLDVPLGVPVERDKVRYRYFPARLLRSYKLAPALAATVWRTASEYDIAHLHSLYLFPQLAAGLACRRHGVSYIIRPHGTLDPYHRGRHRMRKAIYGRLVEHRQLAGAAALHYTSLQEQAHAEAAGMETPGFVVPLGVHADSLTIPEPEARLHALLPETAGRKVLAFLGRLTPKKRPEWLVTALPEILVRHPDVHVVFAGPDDGLGHSLATMAAQLGVSQRISISGTLVGQDRAALLGTARVLALPSEDENFALSVVEAMAVGVPVVVSPGVALAQEVAAAGAGQVVESPAALARAVIAVLTDPEAAARMGEQGRRMATERFGWTIVAESLEREYLAILARQAANYGGQR